MFIPSTTGQLEAEFDGFDTDSSAESSQDIAILCHPHPQYGGSMHDNVVSMLATGFQSKRSSTLRFNFRGVGASEGECGGENAEAEDVQAAIDWCKATHPNASYYLCGYSFGAIMALTILRDSSTDSKLLGSILVAPPVQMLPTALSATSLEIQCPLLVILGSQDSIVAQSSVTEMFGAEKVAILEGTDHFFNGQLDNIVNLTREFVDGT